MGEEPDPERMPLTSADFPVEVQVAFFISGFLSDIWDGASGSYLGKDYGNLEFLFNLYEVDSRKETLFFIKLYDNNIIDYRAKKANQKRKSEERKASSGGNYTHNVKG